MRKQKNKYNLEIDGDGAIELLGIHWIRKCYCIFVRMPELNVSSGALFHSDIT